MLQLVLGKVAVGHQFVVWGITSCGWLQWGLSK